MYDNSPFSSNIYSKQGVFTTFPQCNFSLEFPEVLSQTFICYQWLSMSGNSKIMHCGLLINTPYCGTNYKPLIYIYFKSVILTNKVRCVYWRVSDRISAVCLSLTPIPTHPYFLTAASFSKGIKCLPMKEDVWLSKLSTSHPKKAGHRTDRRLHWRTIFTNLESVRHQ